MSATVCNQPKLNAGPIRPEKENSLSNCQRFSFLIACQRGGDGTIRSLSLSYSRTQYTVVPIGAASFVFVHERKYRARVCVRALLSERAEEWSNES